MELNDRQLEAVRYSGRHLIVSAPAGAGKTFVIVERVKYLISHGADPTTILMLTFTNRAAREMLDRIQLAVPDASIWASTFHSFCYHILKLYLPTDKSRFTVADDDDQGSILRRILKDTRSKESPGSMSEYINLNKSNGISVDGLQDTSKTRAWRIYEEYLEEHNLVDFGGLQTKALEYLPELNQFKHILVDEYHDTSPVQLEIIKLLEPNTDSITVVCDDQQSIYSWRGATIRNILDFPKLYPDTRIINLERNYRSTKAIVNTINKLISHATEKLGDKVLYTNRKYGYEPVVVACPDEYNEAKLVGDRILWDRNYGSHMVLVRTNAQTRVIEEEFVSRRIPYHIIAATAFYRRREIKDCIAYLRWMYNKDDEVALGRIINLPARGIGTKTINRLVLEYGSLSKSIDEYTEDKESRVGRGIDNLRSIRNVMAPMSTGSIGIYLQELLTTSGYLGYMRQDTSIEGRGRIENIESLISGAYEFETKFGVENSVEEYLAVISLLSDSDVDTEAGSVSIMTIHASKGLESKVVHIVGVEEDILPHLLSKLEGNIEEERRLMYVAISRAMDQVYITYCRRRNKNGQPIFPIPSRFIREL